MKSSSRQRSPGAMARSGDNFEESSQSNPSNVESEDFVSNVHPPTDDEGVSSVYFIKLNHCDLQIWRDRHRLINNRLNTLTSASNYYLSVTFKNSNVMTFVRP